MAQQQNAIVQDIAAKVDAIQHAREGAATAKSAGHAPAEDAVGDAEGSNTAGGTQPGLEDDASVLSIDPAPAKDTVDHVEGANADGDGHAPDDVAGVPGPAADADVPSLDSVGVNGVAPLMATATATAASSASPVTLSPAETLPADALLDKAPSPVLASLDVNAADEQPAKKRAKTSGDKKSKSKVKTSIANGWMGNSVGGGPMGTSPLHSETYMLIVWQPSSAAVPRRGASRR